MKTYFTAIVIGVLYGVIDRLYLLRSDYRNYPSYPHGYIIHLSLGAIAAALAAVALPALLEEEYTAITFLVLCAQQFRDIRTMERETLMRLEETLLVPRGRDYIEGIAKVFEARNYLVMFVALATTGGILFINQTVGALIGIGLIFFSKKMMSGKILADIATVHPAKLYFDGPLLMVDDIVMMNVGEEAVKEKIQKEGLAITLHPNDPAAREILNNLGQRQALLHDLAILSGCKAEVGEAAYYPMARKNIDTGVLGIYILPNEKDIDKIIQIAYRTPLLESAMTEPIAKKKEKGRK